MYQFYDILPNFLFSFLQDYEITEGASNGSNILVELFKLFNEFSKTKI